MIVLYCWEAASGRLQAHSRKARNSCWHFSAMIASLPTGSQVFCLPLLLTLGVQVNIHVAAGEAQLLIDKYTHDDFPELVNYVAFRWVNKTHPVACAEPHGLRSGPMGRRGL